MSDDPRCPICKAYEVVRREQEAEIRMMVEILNRHIPNWRTYSTN